MQDVYIVADSAMTVHCTVMSKIHWPPNLLSLLICLMARVQYIIMLHCYYVGFILLQILSDVGFLLSALISEQKSKHWQNLRNSVRNSLHSILGRWHF